MAYLIRPLAFAPQRLPEALDLVWRVFQQFEAPGYTPEGVAEFRSYLEPEAMEERAADGQLKFWICLEEDRVAGVIAVRSPCHISLLFVDPDHHRRGIARALWQEALDFYRRQDGVKAATVNSSPFAVEAYRRLGFAPTGPEQTVKGIRFTPMVCNVQPPFPPVACSPK